MWATYNNDNINLFIQIVNTQLDNIIVGCLVMDDNEFYTGVDYTYTI